MKKIKQILEELWEKRNGLNDKEQSIQTALSQLKSAMMECICNEEEIEEVIITTEAHSETRDWKKELMSVADKKKERNRNLKRINEVAIAIITETLARIERMFE